MSLATTCRLLLIDFLHHYFFIEWWPCSVKRLPQRLLWLVYHRRGSISDPREYQQVKFAVGQPLGYYLSWSLFALTHHLVVWWAALRANPKRRVPYRRYAILGDDVVILDSDVAREYYLILQGLNVKVSEKKSLLSSRGGLEFAKKFMC